MKRVCALLRYAFVMLCPLLMAQTGFPDGKLDPTRGLAATTQAAHEALPEEYIWTVGDATVDRPDHGKFPWQRQQLRVEPHYFRAKFNVKTVPGAATVYIAGPRSASVYLNGKLAAKFESDIDAPIGFHVFSCECA